MKTSFYFVVWILIYPLLGLLHNAWIDSNSFIVALIVVWALSWFINRSMPSTIRYEAALSGMYVLEDVYSDRFNVLIRRLKRQSTIEFISAVYFGVTFIFVLLQLISRSNANDWIALALFGLFAYGAITRASQLGRGARDLAQEPTRENSGNLLRRIYRYDYSAFEVRRAGVSSLRDLLPPKPRGFEAFMIVSLLIAVACALLGLFYAVQALVGLAWSHNPLPFSANVMYFLYGSLAAYFGIRDSFSIYNNLRLK